MAAHATNSSFKGDPAKWSARFPVYQIDFAAVASGKRIATSKRRIRWRFGFSNKDALEAGETGTSCRGEEHDVTIVWSISSGKRLILADGQEVHYSTSRAGFLEYSWTMRGSHVLKVMANASPPMTATPGFRQYDLHVDGQSFFHMPKVYELGLKGPIPAHDRIPGVISHAERSAHVPPSQESRYYDLTLGKYIDPPKSKEQEEADLQRAIQESLEESRRHLNSKPSVSSSRRIDDSKPAAITPSASREAPAQVATSAPAPAPIAERSLLIDFLSDPAPTPSNLLVPAVQPANQWSEDTFVSGTAAPSNYATENYQSSFDSGPIPNENHYGPPVPPALSTDFSMFSPTSQPAPSSVPLSDPWAPQVAYSGYDDPFAPQPVQLPTYNDISSQIMQSYTVGGENPTPPDSTFASGPGLFSTEEHDIGSAHAQANFADDRVEEENPEPAKSKDVVDEALGKLVNLGDLTAPPEDLTSKSFLSMNPFDDGKDKRKGKGGSKGSKGTISRGSEFLGAQPTLGQMKAVKPPSALMKPVMAISPSANVGPGALVLHGTQNGNFGGYGVYGLSPQPSGHQSGYGAPPMQPGYGPPLQMQSHMGYGRLPPSQQMQGYGAPPQMQQNYGQPGPQQHQYQQMPPQQGFGQY